MLSDEQGGHQSGVVPCCRHGLIILAQTQGVGTFAETEKRSSSMPPGWTARLCSAWVLLHTCGGANGPTEKFWYLKGMWAVSRGLR